MEKLFGVEMSLIATGLGAAVAAIAAALALLAWRRPVLLKLGLRPIPRRKTQSALIVLGLMLATLIITAAFVTGDTLSHAVRTYATEGLGEIDEMVRLAPGAPLPGAVGAYFKADRYERLRADLAGYAGIDAVAPVVRETVPAVNVTRRQSARSVEVLGLDATGLALLPAGERVDAAGAALDLAALGPNQVILNAPAARALAAAPGDELQLYPDDAGRRVFVAALVPGGAEPRLLLPLRRAQVLFDQRGRLNFIYISNRGQGLASAALSPQVTEHLRGLLTDPQIAAEVFSLLAQDGSAAAILRAEAVDRTGQYAADLQTLAGLLEAGVFTPEARSLLADPWYGLRVHQLLERGGWHGPRALDRLAWLLAHQAVLEVDDVKWDLLDEGELIASALTLIFVATGSFSIAAGLLLIFLIFVLLAAERKPEMGMARAVGAQRQHLVEMFAYEGGVYDLVSAAVGAGLGAALGLALGAGVGQVIGAETGLVALRANISARSLGVAYSLGLLVTFVTVLVSAYRVSRLNIVAAIRDLPEPAAPAAGVRRLLAPLGAAAQAARALGRRQVRRALGGCLLGVPASLLSLLAAGFASGPLTLLLGLALIGPGRAGTGAARFGVGVSLAIVGGGLLLRRGLGWALRRRPGAADRLAYTLIGAGLAGLWALPPAWLEGPGALRGLAGPEVFLLSGLLLVSGTVLVLMHNGDLLLWGLLRLLGGSRRLAAVLRMAVAYPLASRFRTGLTLGIFAVVVFSVVVIAAAYETSEASLGDVESRTGGWDLRLTTSWTNPIRDLPEAIRASPRLRASDYAVAASVAQFGIEARQGAGTWYGYYGSGVNLAFLQQARVDLRLWAAEFDTPAEVWRAMQERPGYALVDRYSLAERRDSPSRAGQRFELTGVYLEDARMEPVRVELRDGGSGATFFVTVIGVYEPSASASGGLLLSQDALAEALPVPPDPNRHYVRLAPGVDRQAASRALESAFLANGLESVDLLEELQTDQRLERTLIALLQGFLTLGLVVGVAALGVVSTRAVVERRQQIGMLRALGFRRGMVAASFVLEASFVALLGIGLGMGLALIPAYHLLAEAAGDAPAQAFVVPWRTMGIVAAVAWGMALLTTALPALQAARVPPAEALRYE